MPHSHPNATVDRRRRMRPAGSTLVEALTVMAVVVALVGIALPNLDVSGFRLDDEVESIALLVSSARRLAVLRHHDIVLAFDEPGARIRLHHDRDGDGSFDAGEDVRFIRLREDVVFGSEGAPPLAPGRVTVSFVAEQGGLPAVTFRADGTASAPGVIYLTARDAAGTSDPGVRARAIVVDAATGGVACMSHRTATWEVSC